MGHHQQQTDQGCAFPWCEEPKDRGDMCSVHQHVRVSTWGSWLGKPEHQQD